MARSTSNSLRVLFDLQACQASGYYQRGVGNYSLGLFNSVRKADPNADYFSLTSSALPHAIDRASIQANRNIDLSLPLDWNGQTADCLGGNLDSVASVAYSAHCQSINPDVIHVAHNFLDCYDRVASPGAVKNLPGQLLTTTLYDLIPLRFSDHYLRDEVQYRRYHCQLQKLRRFDRLYAISESSRNDAIELLGIEPERVVTVHGGVSEQFAPPNDRQQVRHELWQHYPIKDKLLMYTGGDDFRKNIGGLIECFAQLPKKLLDKTTLVIVGKITEQSQRHYRSIADQHGLKNDSVLFTGFIDDTELLAFYQACDAFVFPSLYEGLGLPVIEAMKCGAPVIGSDNSSISELINQPDALFNIEDNDSLVTALNRVLSDESFANQLREYGLQRSQQYTWENTAEKFSESINQALDEKQKRKVQLALSGDLPRKRIAILTPLPPSQSGIADYSADFLPFLSRHFDIDLYLDGYRTDNTALSASFRMFDISSFAASAPAYDAIVYEIGNSDFHTHMLPLLERFPGVVTLHDAYMSGILSHLEFSLNQSGKYQQELLYSHGPRGRRFIAPDTNDREAIADAVDQLPTTKRILDLATGVISHSAYNLDVARQHYPEGWLAPYRTIAQLMACQPENQQRSQLKQQLGLPQDSIVIASFGHVVWTKRGDLLLEAFAESELLAKASVYLIFVGKLADDKFGKQLSKAIKTTKAKDRIRITGFVSTEQYQQYLQITDIAVQLRTNSRGGTPRSVLDCLANGIPVIVNDYASFKDYDDDVVAKIPAEISKTALADKMEALVSDDKLRTKTAQNGLRYIREKHDPALCAAEYAAAIDEFTQRYNATRLANYQTSMAEHIGDQAIPVLQSLVGDLTAKEFKRTRILIDVSHIASKDHKTGIQRIVRELVSELYLGDITGIEPVAVQLLDGQLFTAKDWLQEQHLLSTYEQHSNTSVIEFEQGDILLMLDSSWERYDEFYPIFDRARDNKVPIITVVYDLLPIRIPECFVEGGPEWFENWFNKAITQSDGMICISAATQTDVENYLESENIDKTMVTGHWHHGSDFTPQHKIKQTNKSNSKALPLPKELQADQYLLMVGTIEPRKQHHLAVAAMEQVWLTQPDFKLCIAGKPGWMVEEFMQSLHEHPQLGKQLVFIEAPSDEELANLYQQAGGLLFLSKGEGYGLPLIEAAAYGVPILCSDIPSFREIADGYVTFSAADSAEGLSKDILNWYEAKQTGDLPASGKMPVPTCAQSAATFIQTLLKILNY